MKITLKSTREGRLDVIVAAETEYTRSFVKQLVDSGSVEVGGVLAKKSGQSVKIGELIELDIPEPVEVVAKSDIPVDILYEDDQIAVINKPQGLTVHPAGGNYTDTLVNALMARLKNLSSINGKIRPGIVHRLDKDTSGVMVVAKTNAAHLNLSRQIADRTVVKQYVAILEGTPEPTEGKIVTLISRSPRNRKLMAVTREGREAITFYRTVVAFPDNSLVTFRILTGRTHQIRVHAKHIGHPVVGDKSYGYKKQRFTLDGQLLHAYRLEFNHPTSGERMSFTAPMPAHFVRVFDVLAAKTGQKCLSETPIPVISVDTPEQM